MSEPSPDFKGIKTGFGVHGARDLVSEPSPDFKGIKTPQNHAKPEPLGLSEPSPDFKGIKTCPLDAHLVPT
ncbi:hypothetical protein [Tepidimonas sp.]|uniref:hypothetical protein n=1 Tax=Tepidimonas sp. TaxID=2002775 RepID=UPI00391DB016